jgi:hypothetical protein
MSSGKKTAGKSAIDQVVAREYTIHLHKRVRFSQITYRQYCDNSRRNVAEGNLGDPDTRRQKC